MKKLIILLAATASIALTSCYKHTTCATYLDNDVETTEVVETNN